MCFFQHFSSVPWLGITFSYITTRIEPVFTSFCHLLFYYFIQFGLYQSLSGFVYMEAFDVSRGIGTRGSRKFAIPTVVSVPGFVNNSIFQTARHTKSSYCQLNWRIPRHLLLKMYEEFKKSENQKIKKQLLILLLLFLFSPILLSTHGSSQTTKKKLSQTRNCSDCVKTTILPKLSFKMKQDMICLNIETDLEKKNVDMGFLWLF